jgi:hypothetical protein
MKRLLAEILPSGLPAISLSRSEEIRCGAGASTSRVQRAGNSLRHWTVETNGWCQFRISFAGEMSQSDSGGCASRPAAPKLPEENNAWH